VDRRFEAWLDDEIAVAEISAAAAGERIAYLFAQDQESMILDVDATAIVRFEQQANIRVPDVVAVNEDPVASIGQDLAAESRAFEGSSGGGGDEPGAVRSDADRDGGARVDAKDQKRIKFHEDESVEYSGFGNRASYMKEILYSA
jgi:hypothetical protein